MAEPTQNSTLKTQTSQAPPGDDALAADLRRAARALLDALPDKIADAPLHQVASALKTTVEVLRMLEGHDAEAPPKEQVIRWEFLYNGEVYPAPPWAVGGVEPPGPLQGRGLRTALGQDGDGQNGAL